MYGGYSEDKGWECGADVYPGISRLEKITLHGLSEFTCWQELFVGLPCAGLSGVRCGDQKDESPDWQVRALRFGIGRIDVLPRPVDQQGRVALA